jgi:hypothetical protein
VRLVAQALEQREARASGKMIVSAFFARPIIAGGVALMPMNALSAAPICPRPPSITTRSGNGLFSSCRRR